jgi:NAD(P)-dependent dehydrogenase (short-subunit alcohol dehydrogenase family)
MVCNVLITGGTDGIGKASARELVKLGYNVIIIGNTEEKGKAAIDELKQAIPEGHLIEPFVSRSREYMADEIAARLTCAPKKLVRIKRLIFINSHLTDRYSFLP